MQPDRDERLKAIYARGDKLRRRRIIRASSGILAVVALAATASYVVVRNETGREVVAVADETATTTTVDRPVQTPTTPPSSTVSVPPVPTTEPDSPCTPQAFAADLGVPLEHIRSEPECVDGYALVRVCEADDEYCPEGYAVFAVVDRHWTRIGHSLQTCIEELVAIGVDPDAASKFEGFFDCFD